MYSCRSTVELIVVYDINIIVSVLLQVNAPQVTPSGPSNGNTTNTTACSSSNHSNSNSSNRSAAELFDLLRSPAGVQRWKQQYDSTYRYRKLRSTPFEGWGNMSTSILAITEESSHHVTAEGKCSAARVHHQGGFMY
jgi:hypothetical protein